MGELGSLARERRPLRSLHPRTIPRCSSGRAALVSCGAERELRSGMVVDPGALVCGRLSRAVSECSARMAMAATARRRPVHPKPLMRVRGALQCTRKPHAPARDVAIVSSAVPRQDGLQESSLLFTEGDAAQRSVLRICLWFVFFEASLSPTCRVLRLRPGWMLGRSESFGAGSSDAHRADSGDRRETSTGSMRAARRHLFLRGRPAAADANAGYASRALTSGRNRRMERQ